MPKISALALVPLICILGLALVFGSLLLRQDRDIAAVPSNFIDKEAPDYEFAAVEGLVNDGRSLLSFRAADFKNNQITIVNVFASWCAPCRDEHPYLMDLSQDDRVSIYGINYGDSARNVRAFLAELGNPYDKIAFDENRRGGIEWGVYGVPETFIVGADGLIKKRYVGPFNQTRYDTDLVPFIEELLALN